MSDLSSTRRERTFALLAQLDPQAGNEVASNLDALSDDFAEIALYETLQLKNTQKKHLP